MSTLTYGQIMFRLLAALMMGCAVVGASLVGAVWLVSWILG